MRADKWLLFCSLSLVSLCSLQAQQLTTFVDGQPARAAEVNGNFNALQTQITALKAQVDTQQASLTQANTTISTLQADINSLKSQIASLQGKTSTASIVGTWDIYSVDPVFFATTQQGVSSDIHSSAISSGTMTFKEDGTFTSTEAGTESQMAIGRSIPPGSNAVQISISSSPTSGSQSGTYSISGNTLTTKSSNETGTATISADRSVLLTRSVEGSRTTLSIGIKR